MADKRRTPGVEQIVDEQIRRWEILKKEREREVQLPVLTLSREAGSKGTRLAELLAEDLGFDLFHQNIVHRMAESAKLSARLIESLDEEGMSIVKEWLTGFSEGFWPDQYLKQLVKVVGTMGKQGRAVIIGRGAHFILPLRRCFRVRVVAPAKMRIAQLAEEHELSKPEAERLMVKTDSERRAFIRQHFHTDIADPHNYDLVLSMERLSLQNAVQTVRSCMERLAQEQR